MVRTRSQSKKHDTNPDDNDTEPMEIDEDDVIFQPTLLPPTLDEVLPGFSSDPALSFLLSSLAPLQKLWMQPSVLILPMRGRGEEDSSLVLVFSWIRIFCWLRQGRDL